MLPYVSLIDAQRLMLDQFEYSDRPAPRSRAPHLSLNRRIPAWKLTVAAILRRAADQLAPASASLPEPTRRRSLAR